MKNLSLLITIIALSTSVFTSCRNNADKKEGESGKKRDKTDKIPSSHGDKKDRKKGIQYKTLEEIGGYKVGEIATDFNLKNTDGKMVSLESIKDTKGYIVTFTCNECPYSKSYEDRIILL